VRLASIHIYPMKAARAVDLEEALVEPWEITGTRGKQPLKMLGKRRRIGKDLVFGQNLIPDSGGVIRVGDPVEILAAA
jgi:uncharacterized protein YcbX